VNKNLHKSYLALQLVTQNASSAGITDIVITPAVSAELSHYSFCQGITFTETGND